MMGLIGTPTLTLISTERARQLSSLAAGRFTVMMSPYQAF